LAKVEKKKQIFERRRRRLGESIDIFRAHVNRIIEESLVVQLSLKVFTAAYPALPEDRHKAVINLKIKRLEVRQARAEKKAYTYNAAALVAKELKYNELDSQVAVLARYIITLKQRKIALSKTAQRPPVSRQILSFGKSVYAYPAIPNLKGSIRRDVMTLQRSTAGVPGSSLTTRAVSSKLPRMLRT
jgi:hypothetical protein